MFPLMPQQPQVPGFHALGEQLDRFITVKVAAVKGHEVQLLAHVPPKQEPRTVGCLVRPRRQQADGAATRFGARTEALFGPHAKHFAGLTKITLKGRHRNPRSSLFSLSFDASDTFQFRPRCQTFPHAMPRVVNDREAIRVLTVANWRYSMKERSTIVAWRVQSWQLYFSIVRRWNGIYCPPRHRKHKLTPSQT